VHIITNDALAIESWQYNNFVLYRKKQKSLLGVGKEVGRRLGV
jgi:hypothetical protein